MRADAPARAEVGGLAEGAGARGAASVVELREAARLHAAETRRRCVNALAPWETGTFDLARREIPVRASVA